MPFYSGMDHVPMSEGFYQPAQVTPAVDLQDYSDWSVGSRRNFLGSAADDKEWQRLWCLIRLNDCRGLPEDMELEEASSEAGVDGEPQGSLQSHFDCSEAGLSSKDLNDAMLIEWPNSHNTSNIFHMGAKMAELRKRGIEEVEDTECLPARAKRARQLIREAAF